MCGKNRQCFHGGEEGKSFSSQGGLSHHVSMVTSRLLDAGHYVAYIVLWVCGLEQVSIGFMTVYIFNVLNIKVFVWFSVTT